jgi:hypothetical protein
VGCPGHGTGVPGTRTILFDPRPSVFAEREKTERTQDDGGEAGCIILRTNNLCPTIAANLSACGAKTNPTAAIIDDVGRAVLQFAGRI